jgi:hypothetical protein
LIIVADANKRKMGATNAIDSVLQAIAPYRNRCSTVVCTVAAYRAHGAERRWQRAQGEARHGGPAPLNPARVAVAASQRRCRSPLQQEPLLPLLAVPPLSLF